MTSWSSTLHSSIWLFLPFAFPKISFLYIYFLIHHLFVHYSILVILILYQSLHLLIFVNSLPFVSFVLLVLHLYFPLFPFSQNSQLTYQSPCFYIFLSHPHSMILL